MQQCRRADGHKPNEQGVTATPSADGRAATQRNRAKRKGRRQKPLRTCGDAEESGPAHGAWPQARSPRKASGDAHGRTGLRRHGVPSTANIHAKSLPKARARKIGREETHSVQPQARARRPVVLSQLGGISNSQFKLDRFFQAANAKTSRLDFEDRESIS